MEALPYVVSVIVFALTWAGLDIFADEAAFRVLYRETLQMAFFMAFLTVGSFLLAMKTFMLARLKDDVYGHASYRKRYLAQYENKYEGNYYRGLLQLGRLLAASVGASFTASILQVTAGFSSSYRTMLVAPALCAGVLSLVLFAWVFVCLNIRDWFAFIEHDAKTEIEKTLS